MSDGDSYHVGQNTMSGEAQINAQFMQDDERKSEFTLLRCRGGGPNHKKAYTHFESLQNIKFSTSLDSLIKYPIFSCCN